MERAPRHRNNFRTLIGGASAVALTSAAVCAYSEHETGDPTYVFDYALENINKPDCEKSSDESMLNVEATLASEADNIVPIGLEQYLDSFGLIKDLAESHGFTLVEPGPFLARVNELKDPERIMRLTEAYLSNFDLQLLTDDEENQAATIKNNPLTHNSVKEKDISTDTARLIARSVIINTSLLPREVMSTIKSKKIRLVTNLKYNDDNLSGFHMRENGTIYLDLNSFYEVDNYTTSTLLHEYLHGVDNYLCGGNKTRASDAQFTSIESDRYIDYISSYAFIESLKGDFWEDRVETLMRIFTFNLHYGIPDDESLIDEKFRLMLARLDERYPGFSGYLSEVSNIIRAS